MSKGSAKLHGRYLVAEGSEAEILQRLQWKTDHDREMQPGDRVGYFLYRTHLETFWIVSAKPITESVLLALGLILHSGHTFTKRTALQIRAPYLRLVGGTEA